VTVNLGLGDLSTVDLTSSEQLPNNTEKQGIPPSVKTRDPGEIPRQGRLRNSESHAAL
jgi:hypothetical protein